MVSGIAAQFTALVNSQSGVSDAVIESAFPIEGAQLDEVVATLAREVVDALLASADMVTKMLEAEKAGAPLFKYGVFINSIIDFLIVAMAIFVAIKAMNKLKRNEPAPAPEAPVDPEDIKLLREIRDALKK